MEELELEAGIILGLISEISGDDSRGKSSLIKESIGFKSKVYLQRNLESFLKIKETLQESINDLVKKYGEKGEDGSIGVSSASEKFVDFEKEYNLLVGNKVKVQVTKLNLEDISFSSEAVYPLVIKFLIN